MVTTLVWLLIALRFVNPTQIVDARQAAATLMGAGEGAGLELGARAVGGLDIVDGHRDLSPCDRDHAPRRPLRRTFCAFAFSAL